MKILIADIETDGLLPTLTKCHCLAIKEWKSDAGTIVYADARGYRPISEGISRLAGGDVLVFHNGIGFDAPAIVQLYGRGSIDVSKVYDTMVTSRFRYPEKRSASLAYLGEELGFEKGEHRLVSIQ
jgi:DNA polymerase I